MILNRLISIINKHYYDLQHKYDNMHLMMVTWYLIDWLFSVLRLIGNISAIYLIMLYVDIIMLHVEMNKTHVKNNFASWHNYLACKAHHILYISYCIY